MGGLYRPPMQVCAGKAMVGGGPDHSAVVVLAVRPSPSDLLTLAAATGRPRELRPSSRRQ